MQLTIRLILAALALAIVLIGFMSAPAHAQSLSPMRKEGTTPTEIKGFRLTVGNPYTQRMSFQLIAMDPLFEHEVSGVSISPDELILAPGTSRNVILAFRIPAPNRERTIGLCVIPTNITGPIQPRVCGTYTGIVLGR